MCPAFPYTLGEHDIAVPPHPAAADFSPRGEEICRMRSLHISLVIGSMSSPIISFLTTTAPRLIEINSLSI